MISFVTYDPSNGRITARFSVSDGQEVNYSNRVTITQEQYEAQPEITMRINVSTKTLEDKAQVHLTTNKTTAGRNETVTVTCNGLVAAGQLAGNDGGTVAVSPQSPSVSMSTNVLGQYKITLVTDLNQYSNDIILVTIS